ncbi:MAG: CPBP family intramembrane metalloprotease [Pseudonocardiales bacterium]|nr:MAG: CPBP family intramembrane metalloprotease [Pseudonocardiales bacterium]
MSRWSEHLQRLLGPALLDTAPGDLSEPNAAVRRRRAVVVATLVVGATLLGFSLSTPPGDPAFYWLTAALAATWTLGGVLSGPLHLGRIKFRNELRRPIVTPILLGLAAAAAFIVGALVIRDITALRSFIDDVLDHARRGSLALVLVVTVLNGVAEEIFFRGALFAAVGRHRPVLISTVIYTLTTLATANPMLTFAAAALGTILGLQRRASGGILAPILTHVTWSSAMLFVLPPLLR